MREKPFDAEKAWKTATLILTICLLSSCLTLQRDREMNVDGIAIMREEFAITRKRDYFDHYSADGVLFKGICICAKYQDTISKRCFTSNDILLIKNYLNSVLYKVKSFDLEPYSINDIHQCAGLFELRYYKKPYVYLLPVIKLPDTILVNCDSVIPASLEKYLMEHLSNYYDSTNVRNRVDVFRQGNRTVPNYSITPTRYRNQN